MSTIRGIDFDYIKTFDTQFANIDPTSPKRLFSEPPINLNYEYLIEDTPYENQKQKQQKLDKVLNSAKKMEEDLDDLNMDLVHALFVTLDDLSDIDAGYRNVIEDMTKNFEIMYEKLIKRDKLAAIK